MALTGYSGLPADTNSTQGIDLSSANQDRSIGVRSGLNPVKDINITFSHVQSWRKSENRNNKTGSKTINFLMLREDKDVGIPFINWGLRWSSLEQLPVLKLLKWKVTLDHTFTGDKATSRQNDRAGTERYKRAFSPLLGLTMNFDNGITTSARMSIIETLDKAEAGDDKTRQVSMSTSFSYMKRGGFNLKLPFMKNVHMQNSVNFSLDYIASNNIRESRRGDAQKFAVIRESSSWTIKPYITYTFSTKVTGTIRFSYREDEDDISGKRVTRDFGFDVNIAIRGN